MNTSPAALDPEALTPEQISDVIHLRVCPPASIRSLTCERQLRLLLKQQTEAISVLEADPRIEERSVPRRKPDGSLARDPKNGRILYDTERVPVSEREVERLEKMINQVRATYAAQLKVGPEARANRADQEARYLASQFGGADEIKAVPSTVRTAAILNFRATKGWL